MVLQSISGLRNLKHLDLYMECPVDRHTIASKISTQDTRSFGHLSSLTALTNLQLFCPHYDLCNAEKADREAQQEALAAALRHMPHLASFKCNCFGLRVSDLAALTSLTHVELEDLEPPGPTEQQQPAAPGPAIAVGRPHQLLSLVLSPDPSPRALAHLGAFPRLREVIIWESRRFVSFSFDQADAIPGGSHLLPDTREVVRQAARALADVRARGGVDDNAWHPEYGNEHVLCINDSVYHELLLPPLAELHPPSSTGHAEWLRELGPLAVPGQRVKLGGLALAAGDLAAIADTFPDAKVGRRFQLGVFVCPAAPVRCRRYTAP